MSESHDFTRHQTVHCVPETPHFQQSSGYTVQSVPDTHTYPLLMKGVSHLTTRDGVAIRSPVLQALSHLHVKIMPGALCPFPILLHSQNLQNYITIYTSCSAFQITSCTWVWWTALSKDPSVPELITHCPHDDFRLIETQPSGQKWAHWEFCCSHT